MRAHERPWRAASERSGARAIGPLLQGQRRGRPAGGPRHETRHWVRPLTANSPRLCFGCACHRYLSRLVVATSDMRSTEQLPPAAMASSLDSMGRQQEQRPLWLCGGIRRPVLPTRRSAPHVGTSTCYIAGADFGSSPPPLCSQTESPNGGRSGGAVSQRDYSEIRFAWAAHGMVSVSGWGQLWKVTAEINAGGRVKLTDPWI